MQTPSLLCLDKIKSFLLPRPKNAHKGLFGHVLIVGGCKGMGGSVLLAGKAALRTGAGLVSIATHAEHSTALISWRPELMIHGIKRSRELYPLLEKATMIIIGPGLGQTHWSKQLFAEILKSPQPKIVDADALNLLAQQKSHSNQWILTPHPGEAARLLHCTITDIQNNRLKNAHELQATYGGVVVLKGEGSLVCTHNSLSICDRGNPGMASAGMGDVLSGIIGALVAQGLNLQQAAELGIYLHATSGDLAAQALGETCLIATDLIDFLPQAMKMLLL